MNTANVISVVLILLIVIGFFIWQKKKSGKGSSDGVGIWGRLTGLFTIEQDDSSLVDRLKERTEQERAKKEELESVRAAKEELLLAQADNRKLRREIDAMTVNSVRRPRR